MDIISNYRDTPGAGAALAAELTEAVAALSATPIHLDERRGLAVYPGGHRVDWSDALDRPARTLGTTNLDDPESFVRFVQRNTTPETVIFGSKRNGRFVAVFNGDPIAETDLPSENQTAGYADHRAVLDLVLADDWAEWARADRETFTQQGFGELVEALAHTMETPDGATMLEIATTLTAKTTLDYSSRTRLDNGDMSFSVEQETVQRAGRGKSSIDIPQEFAFRVPVWEGTEPVVFTARLRVKPAQDGVRLGFRIIRKAEAIDTAFRSVVEQIDAGTGEAPVFSGPAPEPYSRHRR